jgi:hypothetical protein
VRVAVELGEERDGHEDHCPRRRREQACRVNKGFYDSQPLGPVVTIIDQRLFYNEINNVLVLKRMLK